MSTRKQKQPTLEELAELSGVSISTLTRYRRQGVDIFNPDALRAHGANQKNKPSALEPEDMKAAKLRKINLEADRIEHGLGVQRGLFIPAQKVRNDMLAIAAAVRGEMQTLMADIPTWEGMPAADMAKRVTDRWTAICSHLHEATSSIYQQI